ncbi:MAG TPA: V-type ATP synthase subunit F [Candidatus Binatia bacterium]|jgi:vacuolar-type H+-ATPase subunit F/Vma7
MKPLQVIGDADTVLVFALGGVPGRVVHSADEARTAIEEVVNEVHAAGGPKQRPVLLVVTNGIAGRIRDYLRHAMLDASGPVILEVPGFGESPDGGSVQRFVERTLGLRL